MRPLLSPGGLALLLCAALLAASRPARAWTDARPAGLVTELALDRDGGATVTLRIRWRVLAGRFRAFELAELPPDIALLEATAQDAEGAPVPVATRAPAPGRLELTLGEDGGLRRGAVDVVLRYTTSLRAQGAIRRVGDDAVLELTTIPWERGLEAAEIRVAVPASVRRAQWLADETPGVEATVSSELGRDVVRALRRHLPAGARWTARVACDPALFPWLDRPQATLRTDHVERRRALWPALALGAALALALGASAFALGRRTRDALPFVALPPALSFLPVALAALGGALQSLVLLDARGAATLGTLVSAAGFALLVPRLSAPVVPAPGAPARVWPDARVREATARRPRSRAALLALLPALGSLAVGALALARHAVSLGVVTLDLAVLSLAVVASLRPLAPPSDATLLRAATRTLARALARRGDGRLAFRVRGAELAPGAAALRLVPRPGHRLARGVRAVELLPVWRPGALRWRGSALLCVRVEAGSPLERELRLAATRLGRLEVSPEGGELAFVAELLGPDRAALRLLERWLDRALVPAPRAAREEAPLPEPAYASGVAL